MLKLQQRQIEALDRAIAAGDIKGAVRVLNDDEYSADRRADVKELLAALTKDGKLTRSGVVGAFMALGTKLAEMEVAAFAARRELLARIDALDRRLAELERKA